MIYREVTINCVKDNLLREKVTQQEHGAVAFAFTVMNGRELINLTECQRAVYYGTKSDGHVIGNVCTIENDKVIMPLTLQMTTCAGLLKGIIELQYNDGNIRFYGVNFEVYHAPESADIESTDEFTLLESKIAEVDKIIAEGIETAQGKSAFEIAVENGFVGTETEWLESLKGEQGRGIISTEINANGELMLAYSDGSMANVGAVVGAKGDKGDKGETGATGADGNDYVLTEADKTEIANIVINEYDSSLVAILRGDSSATE